MVTRGGEQCPACAACCGVSCAAGRGAQHAQDVFALDGLERCGVGLRGGGVSGLFQLSEGDFQGRAARQDHRALHQVLQFPDVARPRIGGQGCHRRRRDPLDRFFHLLGEFVREEMH